jgi:hypothetical protein
MLWDVTGSSESAQAHAAAQQLRCSCQACRESFIMHIICMRTVAIMIVIIYAPYPYHLTCVSPRAATGIPYTCTRREMVGIDLSMPHDVEAVAMHHQHMVAKAATWRTH